jgi:predicted RNase H-like HicB family nuclease
MRSYIFRVELEEEDGIWSAVVPSMPGCAVDAGSPAEALELIREAAQIFVESLIQDGRPIPADRIDIDSNVVEGAAVAAVVA